MRINNLVLKWEIGGIIFVFTLGALLHFLFEWSGESAPVGVLASVNESVWEHFKQGFWPMCLYAVIEFRFIRNRVNNFFTAKAVAVYLMPLIMGVVFYAYTAVTGHHYLLVDILIFLVAIIAGQLTSYTILNLPKLARYTTVVSLILIFVLALVIILFTYYPPHLPIFLDETGFYGLPI
ncbi:DUF6512 family protein [Chloroflexota bacterium]